MASESAGLPIRPGGQPMPAAADAGLEPPAERRERGLRALSVAARLLAGATVFFFLAFLFAYFYLRSIDQNHFWKPTAELLKEQKESHVSLAPNQGLGAAFVACIILSAILAVVAGRRQKASSSWLAPAIGAIVLGLAAVGVQCVEFVVQKFGPTDGAYASVFCAWIGFYLVAVMGTMYWLEINVATEMREQRKPTARPGEGVIEYEDPDKLLP
ncbi:MAG TPA: hypothetical protein VKG82_05115, partial [Solirubrobacteraceae bacterium]|nr:hypothetical protein [Solirubrobacteraceae bacterium]